jgi:MinD superfamily P-loop ATPase
MTDRSLPTIQLAYCTGCGLCAERCPGHAVEMVDAKPAVLRPSACTYCGACEALCPAGAIALEYEIVIPARQDRAG